MRHPRATSIALICVLGTWAACPREQAYVISRVQLCVTLWPVAHQALLSMGLSRQEYQSGLPCPPPGDLPDPGIKPASPALAGGFFITSEALRQSYEVDTIITPTL